MSYTAEAARATALIKRKGKAVTITRPADTYNPTTGAITGTPVTITGYAVFLPFDASTQTEGFEQGDVVALCDQLDGVPLPNDRIEGYTVITVSKFAPDNDQVIYYELQCRS